MYLLNNVRGWQRKFLRLGLEGTFKKFNNKKYFEILKQEKNFISKSICHLPTTQIDAKKMKRWKYIPKKILTYEILEA